MSHYRMAEGYAELVSEGRTVTQIADETGRSKSFVSRLLATWKNAGPELHSFWREGRIPYEQVRQIAELSRAEQVAAIAARFVPSERRSGARGRPGIDALKALLERARASGRSPDALLALQVACGEASPEALEKIL